MLSNFVIYRTHSRFHLTTQSIIFWVSYDHSKCHISASLPCSQKGLKDNPVSQVITGFVQNSIKKQNKVSLLYDTVKRHVSTPSVLEFITFCKKGYRFSFSPVIPSSIILNIHCASINLWC